MYKPLSSFRVMAMICAISVLAGQGAARFDEPMKKGDRAVLKINERVLKARVENASNESIFEALQLTEDDARITAWAESGDRKISPRFLRIELKTSNQPNGEKRCATRP